MMIPVRQLTIGDILRVNDWHLHVIAVEREIGIAVLTAEFNFPLHFAGDDIVDIITSSGAHPRPHRTAADRSAAASRRAG